MLCISYYYVSYIIRYSYPYHIECRKFIEAFSLVDSCMSDSIPSAETSHFWNLIQEYLVAPHPNAHALRLKLFIVGYSVGYDILWTLKDELSAYISKFPVTFSYTFITFKEYISHLSFIYARGICFTSESN